MDSDALDDLVRRLTARVVKIDERDDHMGAMLEEQSEFNPQQGRMNVDEIASQAERIRESVAALCDLRQREDSSVGTEMFVDAAVDLLEAFRALEAGILDVQADVDTLEAEMADDEDGRDA